jgi:hypothetical protein
MILTAIIFIVLRVLIKYSKMYFLIAIQNYAFSISIVIGTAYLLVKSNSKEFKK